MDESTRQAIQVCKCVICVGTEEVKCKLANEVKLNVTPKRRERERERERRR